MPVQLPVKIGPVSDVYKRQDLVRAVCDKLELEPEFVELDWSTRVDALNRGEVDCLWSGLTVSSDLLDTLDITQTYLASRPVLVVLWDTVEQYQTAEQLNGKTVAVEALSLIHISSKSAVASWTPATAWQAFSTRALQWPHIIPSTQITVVIVTSSGVVIWDEMCIRDSSS